MNTLLIITLTLLINLVGNINCEPDVAADAPPPPPPPIGCPPHCIGYFPVCALDCINGCFKTYPNKCQLDGYNLCKNSYEPAHVFYAKGPCNPRLPECEYCNKNPKCVYDLGQNCFKTILDDCVMHLHNCQNPKSRWVQVFLGQCPSTICNSCPDECTNVCY